MSTHRLHSWHQQRALYFLGCIPGSKPDLAWIQEYNLKNTTLAVDASYASDELTPTDASDFGRIEQADKTSRSLAISISQILSRSQVAQFGYGVTKRSGFLADLPENLIVSSHHTQIAPPDFGLGFD